MAALNLNEKRGAPKKLRIVQGGVENGDKAWLEKAAQKNLDSANTWIAPKDTLPGDDVVIYIGGYGFFATAKCKSIPKIRKDWGNRYGVTLTQIELIRPAISLGIIRRSIPNLTWAIYPRGITTADNETAKKIRTLIRRRRDNSLDFDDDAIKKANIDELRAIALLKARPSATQSERRKVERARSLAIARYILERAEGHCEACCEPAPFLKSDGTPFLEPHHLLKLADGGPDHPRNVIAACPNCHRRAHHSVDAEVFNRRLIKTVGRIEARS